MSERLAKAVADMVLAVKNRERSAFALPENRFHKHKRARDEKASRRGIRRMVRPENARTLIPQLPAPDEILHCLLRGDFVLADIIPLILAERGPCPHLHASTLGLSVKNAEMLRSLVESAKIARLTIVVSHYFQAVDKTTTFHAVLRLLAPVATLKVSRCHAKVILLPTASGDHFVFEGSANLRSSDTIEQLTIFNDAALSSFHATWIDEIAPLPAP